MKRRNIMSVFLTALLFLSSQYVQAAGIPTTEHFSFILYPEEDSVDVDIDIPFGQNVTVNVVFNDSSISGLHDVWPIITYSYPTKTVSETTIRFSYIENVTFQFGWNNLTLSPLLLSEFTVRVFFSGTRAVEVNITITYPYGLVQSTIADSTLGIVALAITIGTIVIFLWFVKKSKNAPS